MKNFINDFYTYDFTGIIHNDGSADERDIESIYNLLKKKMIKKELKLQLL